MAQVTDLNAVGRDREDVSRVLVAVADHFTKTNPTEELEQSSLLVAFGAEAYKLTGRSLDGTAQALAKAALATAPELVPGTTRGEFALILRRAATAGHDWPDGPNDPAIPRITGIPGQRTQPDPKPTVPESRPASKAGA
ncbi:hypothetical protein VSR01_17375 [Actinacidiphila sp. DG2A-62]|uniref:hypothetical protein n=1 Tax=Actinacidiphila sp. DG2A-62 TaxID=3108821 RepID=UPI002DBBE32C|nr:hypothetical protein [Actinacidiphila sp. DG2A-62]MEC3995210.1 hypothetical protein [Actinacidiphila sp. DG2A-62]